MQELSIAEVSEVSGGFGLFNLGTTLVALFVGALAGPAGLGMVLSGLVAAYGINQIEDMGNEQFRQNPNK